MSVKEYLASHTSLEIREHMAYEKHEGPLGQGWTRDTLDQMHYVLQWNNYLLGAWVTKEGEDNPVPKPILRTWREGEQDVHSDDFEADDDAEE